jgi:hypothetical protein
MSDTCHNLIKADMVAKSNVAYPFLYPLFILIKLILLLKLPFDQNLVSNPKFNGNFKRYVNFGRIKGS